MINPKTILGEWVTALQALPNLVAAIGDGSRIQYYTENATVFGQQTENNIRLAILSMPPGSILIAWQGTRPGRLGSALVFVHEFSHLVVMYSVGASDLLDYKNGEYVLVLIAVLTLYNSWRQQPYRPTAGSVLVNAGHGRKPD
jgi:hypothetical protein